MADHDDGRVSSDARLIRDRFGDILHERLKVLSLQSGLGVRKPSGSISGPLSETVVVHGVAVPANSKFLHGVLEAFRSAPNDLDATRPACSASRLSRHGGSLLERIVIDRTFGRRIANEHRNVSRGTRNPAILDEGGERGLGAALMRMRRAPMAGA